MERRDTLWNALVALLRCVFWFNPLVHLAAGAMRADQELACDATVIDRHPSSRRTYADAMLKTELADAALPVGCHWHSSHTFKERLEMLKTKLPSPARRALGGGLFAVASAIVAFAAWAAEPGPAPSTAPPIAADPAAPDLPPHKGHLMFGPHGLLKFGPLTDIQLSSSTASTGPNGEQILEGDVVIKVRPQPGPHRMVRMIKTPEGMQRHEVVEDGTPHDLEVHAQKATITRAADGSVTMEFENGSVQTDDAAPLKILE